jgi:F-type H+-transporting ATPase subunit a
MDIHVSIAAETLFSIGPFHFTNAFLTMLLVMAFLVIFGMRVARKAALQPNSYGQFIFESVIDFLLGMVESTAGKRVGRRIWPLIGGLFIFIIVSNYSGLLPGIGTIGIWKDGGHGEEAALVASAMPGAVDAELAAASEGGRTLVPLFRSPSADLNMTLAMAILAVLIVQVAGVMAHGVGGRIKHMADPWWIFPLEVIAEVSRIVSLSFRLFGNVFAGEILVAVMVGIAAATWFLVATLAVPTIFLYLEILFGFVQALVFSLLVLIYLSLATAGGHGDHDAEESHGH